MSDTAPIDDLLQRVEQLLDALEASNQSSKEFREGCDQLESYLNNQKVSLMAGSALPEPQKSRVTVIIERLSGLQNAPKKGLTFQPDCKNILPTSRIKSHTHPPEFSAHFGQCLHR